MPELPEVEVTRRSFAERAAGARVTRLRLGKPLRWPLGRDQTAFAGEVIGMAERRGKYLWLPVGDGGLLMHLGMSGSLRWFTANDVATDLTTEGTGPSPGELGPHDHFELQTDRGWLRLNDPRRFGAVVWSRSVDEAPARQLLKGLGIEPFSEGFDGRYLHAALRGRRVAVKQALLAGDVVVGAGNIYACEALFLAGIDPRARSGRLSRPRCERLAAAVKQVLARALEVGGSTLRDFSDAHGVAGAFQLEMKVYGREGQPCTVCSATVRRVVQGQRSTFFCPQCQRR
jgi:formamidopyrimidine-DNA glycosylase